MQVSTVNKVEQRGQFLRLGKQMQGLPKMGVSELSSPKEALRAEALADGDRTLKSGPFL